MHRRHLSFLAGCGSSGKSTFLKQVKIIKEGGFSEEVRKTYKPVICQNIITAAQTLISGMELYEFPYVTDKAENCANMIMDLNVAEVERLDTEILAAVNEVWNDANVQICYEHRDELYLLDSTKYYMEKLDTIAAEDYIPTNLDVVKSRRPTVSVEEYMVPVQNYPKMLWIVDVGGQKSERPKWIHCFEHCAAFIFVSAISEYNQMNAKNQNRLRESIGLFKALLSASVFNKTSVVLFLNKIDIFDEKIMKYNLCDYFPDYDGPKKDPLAAREFLAERFKRCCSKKMYLRYTCATDTGNIRAFFSSLQDHIMRRLMKECNFG